MSSKFKSHKRLGKEHLVTAPKQEELLEMKLNLTVLAMLLLAAGEWFPVLKVIYWVVIHSMTDVELQMVCSSILVKMLQ